MIDFVLNDRVCQLGLGLIAFGLFSSQGTIQNNQTQSAQIASQRRADQYQGQLAAVNKETANQRYEQGCVPIFVPDSGNVSMALSEGITVVDGNAKTPLPAGTPVCDSLGNTGILQYHPTSGAIVVGDVRGLADPEVVQNALARWGLPIKTALVSKESKK